MKKLIHEILEDEAFAFAAEDNAKVRSEYYREFNETIKKEALSVVKYIYLNASPIVRSQIESYLSYNKNGWKAFIKTVCNNYMLSYNYMLGAIHESGDKIFKVSEDLAEALYHTDIEIEVANIRPIFNSFIIYVDGNSLRHIGEYSPPSNPNEKSIVEYFVSYVMVEFVDSPNSGKIMRMVFGYYDQGTDSDNFMNWNNSSFLELELSGGGTFKPKDSNNGLGHFFSEQSLFNPEQIEKAKKYNEAIINFIFSFMLYVTHKRDDMELLPPTQLPITTHNAKKARRLIQANKDQSKYNIYIVGKKYSGIFAESKKQFINHSLDHKVIVRGHWRNQWYGKKKLSDGTKLPGEYQKEIWIEPFFKGIEFEIGKATIYKVE